VSLPAALERAAAALPEQADAIRPANGDPQRLLASLPRAGAAQVLSWLLANEPDAAEELLGEWFEPPAGLEAVLAVDEASLPKAGRKLLRRVRHQLASKGVKLEQPAPAPTVARLPRVADELSGAAVTAPDPLGACLAYLVESHPSGGARLFEIAFAEGRGILNVEVYAAGRSKVRAFLRDVTGRRSLTAVEVPSDALRALLVRAAAAQPEDRPLPAGWREWQGHLGEVAPGTPTPGEFAGQALGEPVEPLDLAPALALVAEGRVGPWPDREVLERIAKRLQETAESTLIVRGPQRREQADVVIGEGAEEAFAGAGAVRMAALFRHAAFVFQCRGDEGAARASLAAAVAFTGRPVAENPLARALFERPLLPLLERLEHREHEEASKSSLLVKPGAGPGGIR
jgi:hypothetical protein